MSKLNILVTDRYSAESLETIKSKLNANVVLSEFSPKPEDLKSADALLIRSRTKIDANLISQAPKLKVIVTATSGFDHIALKATRNNNITVMYTPDANAQSAAELTLLLALAALRKSHAHHKAMQNGLWKDSTPPGVELHNKTVGIVGLGRVGSKVAALAQAFGAKVLSHDPYQNDEVFERLKLQRLGLTELFSQADIVTLHVPLNSETRRLIRKETIELMNEGVVIVNTSRGQVIDEGALVSALDSGHIHAAGLDVFEHEPLARESRLRKMPNVILTPHIGAYTNEAYHQASYSAAEKLIDYFLKQKITDELKL